MEHLLTTKEAAELLGKHHAVLADLRHQGRGPKFIRMGGRSIRYRPSDLLAWLEENTVTPGAEKAGGV